MNPKSNIAGRGIYRISILLLAFQIAGCMVATGSVDTGDNLNESKVKTIQRERMTRFELLQKFGPPNAVLRPGSTAKVSTGMDNQELSFETAFLPFADKHESRPNNVVFYYQNIESSAYGAAVLFAMSQKTVIKRARLWVLIDGSRDVVIDYFYRND